MENYIKKILKENLLTDKGNTLIKHKSPTNDDAFYFDILDEYGDKIGIIELLDLTKYDYWREQGINGYIVTNSKINIRNKGLGRDAYKLLFKKLDKPIFSDDVRSHDANKMWDFFVSIGLAKYDAKIGRYYSLK